MTTLGPEGSHLKGFLPLPRYHSEIIQGIVDSGDRGVEVPESHQHKRSVGTSGQRNREGHQGEETELEAGGQPQQSDKRHLEKGKGRKDEARLNGVGMGTSESRAGRTALAGRGHQDVCCTQD